MSSAPSNSESPDCTLNPSGSGRSDPLEPLTKPMTWRHGCLGAASPIAILLPFMLSLLAGPGGRVRVVCIRMLQRLGLREESFLIVPAVIIGMVTAAAAVGF